MQYTISHVINSMLFPECPEEGVLYMPQTIQTGGAISVLEKHTASEEPAEKKR